MNHQQLNYLKLLSKQYPSIESVSTEIINLQAILSLPKGTEHFLTDIHGEYEAFIHILRNASGVIKRKIDEAFGDSLSDKEKKSFATLVYYPKEKLEIMLAKENTSEFLKDTIYKLIVLCRVTAFKYTRSKVRKALPKSFRYILEELLHEKENETDKQEYYSQIIESIIDVKQGHAFVVALCQVIRRLVVDRLHIVGDIYDRGPGAHIILDALIDHHSVDVQWGNHDIIWMGAGLGSEVCIANVLRISLRYNNLETLEEGYGVNLLPLATFASKTYTGPIHKNFYPKTKATSPAEIDESLVAKMHKAITIIQLKLEGQVIQRRPEFQMQDRLILDKISQNLRQVHLEGAYYDLLDHDFPTLDLDHPFELTCEEKMVMDKLKRFFLMSDKLSKHTRFLFKKGSIYLNYNGNLLYHGGVPIRQDLSFKTFKYKGHYYQGKALFDFFDDMVKKGFSKNPPEESLDFMWYLWNGPCSPLFAKSKMATFERYFLKEKHLHKEVQNPYFDHRDNEDLIKRILWDFNLNQDFSSIISGHVPVKAADGENPVKCKEKMFVIDGGFSKAYHKTTGIAGYTLTFNSRGMMLVAHEPFDSLKSAIEDETDSLPMTVYTKNSPKRLFVKDTDIGKNIQEDIKTLKTLLEAYERHQIKERELYKKY